MMPFPPISFGFEYAALTFALLLPKGGTLPAFKSSMLRGIIASSIRKFVCHTGENNCANCAYGAGCIYCRTFEPQTGVCGQTRQHQYVIRCTDMRTKFSSGELFEFDSLMFGESTRAFAYFIKGLMNARRKGLGGGRAPFEVTRITSRSLPVFGGGELDARCVVSEYTNRADSICPNEIVVNFQTPFRTKDGGKLAARLTAAIFIRALMDRLVGLNMIQQEAAFGWLKSVQSNLGDEICLATNGLKWQEFERYSNRQKTSMQLGGLVGKVKFSGPSLHVLLPIIRIGELTHIGKATTFGLGKYVIEGEKNEL